MTTHPPLILLTNDDGVYSPGLHAMAEIAAGLGEIVIAAPREQATGASRSVPASSDGRIDIVHLPINGSQHPAYAVGGAPAQAVLHAVLELLPRRPDLVISGINYGENVGSGITHSGTVGAAIEAAALGIPALAASLQLLTGEYYHYQDLDFSTAAHFTAKIASLVLQNPLPPDVDILKIDVPAGATLETPWQMTRQSRLRYYVPYAVRPGGLGEPGNINVNIQVERDESEPGTDVHAVYFDQSISITPLSIDLTSRVDLEALSEKLRLK